MSFIFYDADEWETVFHSETHGHFQGIPLGSCGMSQRRRPSVEVKRIKAERARREEDEILARAEQIKQARAAG